MDKAKPEKELYELLKSMVFSFQTMGRNKNYTDFPTLRVFMEEVGEHPQVMSIQDSYYLKTDLVKVLNVEETVSSVKIAREDLKVTQEHFIFKLSKGYYLEAISESFSEDEFDLTKKETEKVQVIVSMTILHPSEKSSCYKENFLEDLLSKIQKCKLKKRYSYPYVGTLCHDSGEYFLRDFPITKEYKIVEGDLHYGEGFEEFHTELLKRMKSGSKGLVLFHGAPGTGKTFYVRSLLKDLISMGKYVIYLPPTMMDHISSPEMLNFLAETLQEKSEMGISCILLLEDAEQVLNSRKVERSSGITNLLNITDGILNDMLHLQVIATFNMEIANIDEALLRPERLIAKKEFKPLKKDQAQKLADFLKIEKKILKDSTLAEIYSKRKNNEILSHGYEVESKKIGFNSGI